MSRLDPPQDRNVSFLFTRCQARLDGDDLLVTVPAPRVSCRGGVSTPDAHDPFSGHLADPTQFCPLANAANFNSMKMPLNLDGGRHPCR